MVLTTTLASYVGSRKVLEVTPVQATGGAVDTGVEAPRSRRIRTALSIVLIAGGVALLGLGILVGMVNPAGVLVAFLGGVASFTGIMVGAYRILPATLRLVGRLFGRGPAARLAAANAIRYPDRSTRTAVGLLIGVTLVTTFAVAMYSYRSMLVDEYDEASVDQVLTVTVGIMTGLIGFSAVIAAVGMVNNLLLSILQRTREIGLLRALGFTRKQIRTMIDRLGEQPDGGRVDGLRSDSRHRLRLGRSTIAAGLAGFAWTHRPHSAVGRHRRNRAVRWTPRPRCVTDSGATCQSDLTGTCIGGRLTSRSVPLGDCQGPAVQTIAPADASAQASLSSCAICASA